MKLEQEQQKREPKWTFKQLIENKDLRMPLYLVCALAVCQQLSGINVVSTLSPVAPHPIYLVSRPTPSIS